MIMIIMMNGECRE